VDRAACGWIGPRIGVSFFYRQFSTTRDTQFDGTLELVIAKPHCRGDRFTRTPAPLKKQLCLRQVKSSTQVASS
jgi:hypothetical protein